MSTKRIREFLEWYSRAMPSDAPSAPPGGPKARAALADLAAIERAAKLIAKATENGWPTTPMGSLNLQHSFELLASIAKDAP